MPQINKPSSYFNTKLYTGNGSTQSISGIGFQPDTVWVKARSGTYGTENHFIYDVIRGVNTRLIPNGTSVEATDTTGLSSFDSDGFSSGNKTEVNGSSTEYVAWNWKANGAGVTNNDGSITSNVSASTTSGFSIVSYTGTGANATVGHGLSSAPKIVLTKNRNTADNWLMYHASTGNTKALYLNENFIAGTSSAYWNNTSPTNSVFSVGTEVPMNKSGDSIIAYCFAEKKGFSKFGSYTGNGNADGTFVYTGFKPSFVMWKNTTTGSTNWHIVDNKRDTFNIVDKLLLPNESGSEITQSALDLTSNGFKIRVTNGFVNTSGDNYIYMAFAENPLVGTNNTPATAR